MYVYLKITVDGIPKEMSVKRNWHPLRWNGKAGRASSTKENSKQLNVYLDSVQAKVYEVKQKLIDTGQLVTSLALIEIISGAEQRRRGLMMLFKEHNDEMKKMIGKGFAKGTWTNFNTTYNHVLSFLTIQYQTDEINILSLNLEFVKRLYNWFRTEKNLGHNSVLKNY
jgi:hypothetical protein